MRVGTSAGGARAKAVLAWNETTAEFRSGQAPAEKGFSHWLMKFDGVDNNKDKELADAQGYGRIEYAYYFMATDAGLNMQECRLYEENGRAHFLTRRFDRLDDGNKLHMQSLGALMHFDFNLAGAYSYEQAVQVIRQLKLPMADIEQQFIRAAFNVITRNQDDHVKNIAFLMNRKGQWRLSPAFDVVYAFNPAGAWTAQHQMSLNGKRDNFTQHDLLEFAGSSGIKKRRAQQLLDRIAASVSDWPGHAIRAGVPGDDQQRIAAAMRRDLIANDKK